MINGIYDVVLKMPAGARKGTIELNEQDGVVNGTITIKSKENAFSDGKFLNGHLSIEGDLHTPLGKIKYQLEGTVEDDKLDALIFSSKGKFKVSGTKQ